MKRIAILLTMLSLNLSTMSAAARVRAAGQARVTEHEAHSAAPIRLNHPRSKRSF